MEPLSIEAGLVIVLCGLAVVMGLLGLFQGKVPCKEGRTSLKIALSFLIATMVLIILILVHGPNPEGNPLTEEETATQCDS